MHEISLFFGGNNADEIFAIFIPIVAIVMVFSIPIAAIITEYFQKKNRAQVLQRAIEKGVPVESLKLEDETKRRMPYRSGMVTSAVGVGILIFGFAMSWALGATGEEDSEVMMAVFGAGGALTLLIGVALLINDKMNYKRFFENGNGK